MGKNLKDSGYWEWRWEGAAVHTHCWWGCELIQPLWKAICPYSKQNWNWKCMFTETLRCHFHVYYPERIARNCSIVCNRKVNWKQLPSTRTDMGTATSRENIPLSEKAWCRSVYENVSKHTANNTMNYSWPPLSVGVNMREEASESNPNSRRGAI